MKEEALKYGFKEGCKGILHYGDIKSRDVRDIKLVPSSFEKEYYSIHAGTLPAISYLGYSKNFEDVKQLIDVLEKLVIE